MDLARKTKPHVAVITIDSAEAASALHDLTTCFDDLPEFGCPPEYIRMKDALHSFLVTPHLVEPGVVFKSVQRNAFGGIFTDDADRVLIRKVSGHECYFGISDETSALLMYPVNEHSEVGWVPVSEADAVKSAICTLLSVLPREAEGSDIDDLVMWSLDRMTL